MSISNLLMINEISWMEVLVTAKVFLFSELGIAGTPYYMGHVSLRVGFSCANLNLSDFFIFL